ncbi:flagellar hook capping FlgD N-terminal domain-containing protein [Halodurantibacterium flavum]|uniref:Basal-body rod modification protein FlgD n=1 Tax=Halodurantibacterium flavum TaxID=1382802 RepID=A0ABW4SA68_9RHOB
MEITSTSTTTTSTNGAMTQTGSVGGDYETFLRMLTTQLQNQDPLNPMEASDFAVQLATFSGVEQQVQTNQLLQALASQMALMGLGQLAHWVGMEARAPVDAWYDGDPVTLTPRIPMVADRATLVVKNEMGNEVERRDIALTTEVMQWSGLSAAGTPYPSGHYSFELISYEGDKVLTTEVVPLYARVVETQVEQGQIVLVFEGGKRILASDASGMRNPV